jgi:hypothetical protein
MEFQGAEDTYILGPEKLRSAHSKGQGGCRILNKSCGKIKFNQLLFFITSHIGHYLRRLARSGALCQVFWCFKSSIS